MLNMTQVAVLAMENDGRDIQGACMVAAIYIARAVIGSEKKAIVRNEIKTLLEMSSVDADKKMPKSTLNRFIAQGLTLATRLTVLPPKGVRMLKQDRAWLATVAAEADASTTDASAIDHCTTLVNFVKQYTVEIKVGGKLEEVPVINAARLSRLINPPIAKPAAFGVIQSAIKRAAELSIDDIDVLTKQLASQRAKAAIAAALDEPLAIAA